MQQTKLFGFIREDTKLISDGGSSNIEFSTFEVMIEQSYNEGKLDSLVILSYDIQFSVIYWLVEKWKIKFWKLATTIQTSRFLPITLQKGHTEVFVRVLTPANYVLNFIDVTSLPILL